MDGKQLWHGRLYNLFVSVLKGRFNEKTDNEPCSFHSVMLHEYCLTVMLLLP